MNDYFSFSQLFIESNLKEHSQRILSHHQINLRYKQAFSGCFIPPLFILPSFFPLIEYKDDWKLTSTPKKSKPQKNQKSQGNQNTRGAVSDDIPLPQVDPVAAAYINSYISVQFSLRFAKYVMNPVNRIKLLIADNEYSKEALAYYKSNQLNIKKLEELIACEETKYRNQLKQIRYTVKRKLPNGTERETTLDLTPKQIDEVIGYAKADADERYLDKYFQQARALIIQSARFTEKEYTAEELVDLPQIRAMLDLIVYAEGTGAGYGTIVKGKVEQAKYFPDLIGQRDVTIQDLSKFPDIYVRWSPSRPLSSAAGRYQINHDTWIDFGRGDFSPRSQDLAAVRIMIRENMIEPLLSGNVKQAIFAGGTRRWMSFPYDETGKSAAAGQPAKPIGELLGKYNEFLAKY